MGAYHSQNPRSFLAPPGPSLGLLPPHHAGIPDQVRDACSRTKHVWGFTNRLSEQDRHELATQKDSVDIATKRESTALWNNGQAVRPTAAPPSAVSAAAAACAGAAAGAAAARFRIPERGPAGPDPQQRNR